MENCNRTPARTCDSNRTACSMPARPVSHSCNIKNDPLSNMPAAMAYVPWQYFKEVYEPDKALLYGTIFPELNKPFYGKGGCPR